MSSKRRVVITGLGILAPGAIGAESFWDLVSGGKSGLSQIALHNMESFRLQTAGEIKEFEPKKLIENRKAIKVMARDIQLAVAAAKLAMEDSGLIEKKPDPTRFGVSLGSGLINTSVQEMSAAVKESIDETGNFNLQKFGSDGMHALTPLWLLKYLPNMLSCHISIIHNAQGPNNSITTGCAAGAQAIGEAYRIIERDDADLFIAGAGESKIDPLSWARFEMLGLLTQDGKVPEKSVRPFDANRDGFVLGEAASILILEELEHAKKRGVKIYGELVGFGSSASASPLLKKIDTRAQKLAMQLALNDAHLQPKEIDAILANGLGTKETDKLEAQAIQELFGPESKTIPLTSTKGTTGYIGSVSGALGLATSLLSLKYNVLPPTLNYETPDPECDLNVVCGESRKSKINHVLVNAFGLGGQNAALVVRRYE